MVRYAIVGESPGLIECGYGVQSVMVHPKCWSWICCGDQGITIRGLGNAPAKPKNSDAALGAKVTCDAPAFFLFFTV